MPSNGNEEFLRIWFNNDKKEEYFEINRLDLGNLVSVSKDKYKLYNKMSRNSIKSIKDYNFKDKKIAIIISQKPYVEKIGLFLINFLNTNFSDFDSAFDNFYSMYGCDFLYNYSTYEIYEDTFNTEKDAYDNFRILHDRGFKELITLQNNYKKAVDFIFNLNKDDIYNEYSSKSKLSACLVTNKFHLKEHSSNIEVKSKMNNYNDDSKIKMSFDTILSEIDCNSFMIKLIDVYLIDKLEVALFIVLHQLVNNESIIKKCHICNKYFVPSKANELYCEFFNETNGTICRDVGAFQIYKKNLESVPALLEYRRTYNKKSNEVSRKKDDIKLKESFDKWKKSAQAKIKEYKQKKVTEDELYKWMIENK